MTFEVGNQVRYIGPSEEFRGYGLGVITRISKGYAIVSFEDNQAKAKILFENIVIVEDEAPTTINREDFERAFTAATQRMIDGFIKSKVPLVKVMDYSGIMSLTGTLIEDELFGIGEVDETTEVDKDDD